MADLLRSELFRMARRWMPRVLLIILAVVLVAFYLLLWSVLRTEDETGADATDLRDTLRLAAVRDAGLGITHELGSVLIVILAASTIATEYGWGTIRTLLPRATSRPALVAAKLLSLVVFAVVLVAFGFGVALGASGLVTAIEGLDSDLGSAFLLESAVALARTVFVMLPYAALAFVVALWGRSSAAGISVGLVVLLLEELVMALLDALSDAFDWLPGALLSENVNAVMSLNDTGTTDTFEPPSDLPDPWQAAGVLTLYTAVFVALAFWRFRRRDITAG